MGMGPFAVAAFESVMGLVGLMGLILVGLILVLEESPVGRRWRKVGEASAFL